MFSTPHRFDLEPVDAGFVFSFCETHHVSLRQEYVGEVWR